MISRLRAWLAGFVRRHVVDDEPNKLGDMAFQLYERAWAESGCQPYHYRFGRFFVVRANSDAEAAEYLAAFSGYTEERSR